MPRVKIRWFGHSGFSLQDPSGKTVLVDPWFQGNPTAPSGPEDVRKAEFLLLTHDHFDHAADAASLARQTGALVVGIFELIGDLKAKGVPESQLLHGGIGMNVGGTVVLDGFSLTMTEAKHSCTLGAPVGYVIQTPSGLTVYHCGGHGHLRRHGAPRRTLSHRRGTPADRFGFHDGLPAGGEGGGTA